MIRRFANTQVKQNRALNATQDAIYTTKRTLKPVVNIRTGAIAVVSILVLGLTGNAVVATPETASNLAVEPQSGYGGQAVIDEVASAYIAAEIATRTGMALQEDVVANAEAVAAQREVVTSGDNYLSKPYIVATDAKTSRDIVKHVVAADETLESIAEEYGVTTDTIRWANDLNQTAVVNAGDELTIPPVSGVLHTVVEGDSPQTLAEKYGARAEEIIRFNDAEVNGLVLGAQVVIPDGAEPAPAPTFNSYSTPTFYAPQYNGNGYSFGYCTYHAANRRQEIGNPIPSDLGNANTWYWRANAAGLPTGATPKAGAVLWHKNTGLAGGLGHVAYVESVNDDGSFNVSDMNYPYWGSVTYRTVPASETGSYLFIY